jgi:Septum formation
MTDSDTPGGAGLPDQPIPSPASLPDSATAEQAADDATAAASQVEPTLESSPGYGLPTGMAGEPAAGIDSVGAPAETVPADLSGYQPGAPADSAPADPSGYQPGAPADSGTYSGAIPGAGDGPAGWAPSAGAAPTRKRRPIRAIVLIAVVVLIIGAGLVLTQGQKNASDLAVGDCFEVPTKTTDIDTVKSGPCNESHTGEIFFVGNYPDAATYPADADFEQFAQDQCNPVYTSYVGASLDSTPDLTVGFFYPQSEGWSNGDRVVKCYVTRVDGGPMTKSMKGSGGK